MEPITHLEYRPILLQVGAADTEAAKQAVEVKEAVPGERTRGGTFAEFEDCALSSGSIISHPAAIALHQVAPQVEGDVARIDDGDDAQVGRVEPHCPIVRPHDPVADEAVLLVVGWR